MFCYRCKAYKGRKCYFDSSIKSKCERTEEEVLKQLNILNLKHDLDIIASEYQIAKDKSKRDLLKWKWYKRLRRG